MKNIIQKYLPENMVEYLKNRLNQYRQLKELKRLRKFDDERYKKYAYNLNKEYSFNNLRSKITFHYHSIEKGLSNSNFRLGFGKNALTQLFFSLDKYLKYEYPTDDSRFQQALSVVNSYISIHKREEFKIEWVEKEFEKYEQYLLKENFPIGGATSFKKDDINDYSEYNFKELAMKRHSIRDFGESIVDERDIIEAIQISTKSPSVCNRQSVFVHQVRNKDHINKILEIQGGLRGYGKNLQEVLIVTASKEYMNGAHERNQTYIDGGIFLMSLVYALTYKNIASCILNANFTVEKEQKLRDEFEISYAEDVIAFVGIGSYPVEGKIANSPRDSYEQLVTNH